MSSAMKRMSCTALSTALARHLSALSEWAVVRTPFPAGYRRREGQCSQVDAGASQVDASQVDCWFLLSQVDCLTGVE